MAIVYPAKLLVNGRAEKDLFPEWDAALSGSRIDLTHESQSYYATKVAIPQNNQGPFDFRPMASTSTPRYVNQVTFDINRQTDERSQPPADSYASSVTNEKTVIPGATASANETGQAPPSGQRPVSPDRNAQPNEPIQSSKAQGGRQ